MKKLFAVLILCLSFSVCAEVTTHTSQEISYLFAQLKDSGCEFKRNDTWYKADAASQHLNKKYQYLLGKGHITTTEDFIARAASESSMSHKAYIVKCGETETKSAVWFKEALNKYRNAQK